MNKLTGEMRYMRYAVSVFAAALAALWLALPVCAGIDISLGCKGCPVPATGTVSAAFPTDVSRIEATADIPGKEKLKASFIWYSPDGSVFSRTDKLGFPSAGSGTIRLTGSISNPAIPGWWKVEVVSGDTTASMDFVLTDDPATLAAGGGTTAGKVTAVGRLDENSPEISDALKAASRDADPLVRKAAMEKSGNVDALWAMDILHAGGSDASPGVRAAAYAAMTAKGGETGRSAASSALTDTSPDVRLLTAVALGGLDDGWVVELLGKYMADPDSRVRTAALGALSLQDGDDVLSTVAAGLKSDSPEFRKNVLTVILEKEGPDRASILAGLLSDTDPDIKWRAATALQEELGKWDRVRAVPLLSDLDEEVALTAFGMLSDARMDSAMEAALGSTHASIRIAAARYLADRGGTYAASGLAAAVTDADPDIRRVAIDGLAEMGEEGAPGLKVALSDSIPGHRLDAARALSALGPELAKDGMRKAATDDDERIRLAGLTYLVEHNAAGLPELLAGYTDDPSRDVRSYALDELCGIGPPDASDAMAGYFVSGGLATKYKVLGCIEGGTDDGSIAIYRAALKDPEAGIRVAGIQMLATAGRYADVYGLATDPDQDVKRAALAAMNDKPEQGMLPSLREAAADQNRGVGLMALEVLSGISGPDAGLVISGLVDDISIDVRELARKLVLTRKDAGVAPGLVAMLDDPASSVRKSAARALTGLAGEHVDGYIVPAFRTAGTDARALITGILADRGSDRLPEVIAYGLADDEIAVRSAAVDAAGRLPEDLKGGVYDSLATSAYQDVRLAAASGVTGEHAGRALAILLGDRDAEVRRAASGRLGDMPLELADPLLPALVADLDGYVAANAMAYIDGHADKVDAVAAYLSAVGGPHPDIVTDAVEMLAKSKDPRALPVLLAMFRKGYYKQGMVRGMADTPGDAPVDALAAVYRESPREDRLRLAAVRALNGRGATALPVLRAALADTTVDVRVEAVDSIASLTDSPEKLDTLRAALPENNHEVGRAALEALAASDSPEALSVAMSALGYDWLSERAMNVLSSGITSDNVAGIDMAAVHGIGDDGKRLGVVKLLLNAGLDNEKAIGLLSDPSPEVRHAVVERLRSIPGEEAAYGLLLASADRYGTVADAARAGVGARPTAEMSGAIKLLLAKVTTTDTLRAIPEALHDAGLLRELVAGIPDVDTRSLEAVLSPMVARSAPYDVPALVDGIKARDIDVRMFVLRALARIEPPTGADALSDALKRNPSLMPEVIDAAAGTPSYRRVFELAMSFPDTQYRIPALMKAAALSGEDAGRMVMTAYASTDPALKQAALGMAVKNGYLDVLELAATDGSSSVRAEAARGLGFSSGTKRVGILTKLVTETDPKVSDAALDSLAAAGDVPPELWKGLAGKEMPKHVRLTALGRLAKLKEPEYSGVFADALADRDADISAAGAAGLKAMGKAGLPALYEMLKVQDVSVKALDAVADIADPSSEAEVVAMLPGLKGRELAAALRAIGAVGGPDSLAAVSGLFGGLTPVEKSAALKAVSAMRLTGTEQTLTGLIDAALSDPDEQVRFYAANLAGTLKVKAVRDRLAVAAATENSALVKGAIKTALGRL